MRSFERECRNGRGGGIGAKKEMRGNVNAGGGNVSFRSSCVERQLPGEKIKEGGKKGMAQIGGEMRADLKPGEDPNQPINLKEKPRLAN